MATRLAVPMALAGMALGILANDARLARVALAGAVLAGSVTIAMGVVRRPALAVACAALGIGLALGVWRGAGAELPSGPASVTALIGRGELRLVGTVVDDPRPRGGSQQVVLDHLVAAREGGRGHPALGRVLATLPRSVPLVVGRPVSVLAQVDAPVAFDGFDYPAYLARQGIEGLVRAREAQLADGPPRKRVGIRPEGRAPARDGTHILSPGGERIGIITSGGFGPTVNGPVAMGYVPAALAGEGQILIADVRGADVSVCVSPLPFTPHRYVRGAK